MPWRHASPMDQRTQFIAEHLRGGRTITELCDDYGVSRKTGYKWIERYLRHGPAGLEERSRCPHRAANQTADEIVTAILEARRRHPTWGSKKLRALLQKPNRRIRHRLLRMIEYLGNHQESRWRSRRYRLKDLEEPASLARLDSRGHSESR